MIVDLDRFKVMNDFLGHAIGRPTARSRSPTEFVRACAWTTTVARLGGDEFVVLIDEANSEIEVVASAYRILDLVSGSVNIGGHHVIHTASIGIAIAESGDHPVADSICSVGPTRRCTSPRPEVVTRR